MVQTPTLVTFACLDHRLLAGQKESDRSFLIVSITNILVREPRLSIVPNVFNTNS